MVESVWLWHLAGKLFTTGISCCMACVSVCGGCHNCPHVCCCGLQDEYAGFNSSRVVEDFVYYADTVFSHLGRFVKTWITFNEPLVTCDLGYKYGECGCGLTLFPARSSQPFESDNSQVSLH